MVKIEIELDEETFERAKKIAEKNHCTLSELIKVTIAQLDEATLARIHWLSKVHNCTRAELIAEAVRQLAVAEVDKYPMLGGWEDEAELVDEIVADIMRDRAAHPLNQQFVKVTT
jgi:predicted transcriptional regulator